MFTSSGLPFDEVGSYPKCEEVIYNNMWGKNYAFVQNVHIHQKIGLELPDYDAGRSEAFSRLVCVAIITIMQHNCNVAAPDHGHTFLAINAAS